MAPPQPGDMFPLHVGWKLPDEHHLEVTLDAQVEDLEPDKNRLRCRLLRIQSARGSQPEAQVEPYYFQRVLALVGKRALVPLDAPNGLVLPLRLTTLTGEPPFFFD